MDDVSQVRYEWRVDGLNDFERNLSSIDSLEQANPGAEDDRRKRDGEFIDQSSVELLEDYVSTASNADVFSSGDLARLPQGTLDSIINEVERGPAWALPGAANLLGQDEDPSMEGRLVGPETFSSVEHPLAHDAHSGAVEGRLQEAVFLACLTAFAKLEILAEELLLEQPLLEIHPLAEPIVVTRVVGVRHIHSFRGDEAVESHSHAEEHFAHG
jgi:hypothetical protein